MVAPLLWGRPQAGRAENNAGKILQSSPGSPETLLGHLVNPADSFQDDVTISASGPHVACQYLPVHHPQQMNEFSLFTVWKASLVHHPFSDWFIHSLRLLRACLSNRYEWILMNGYFYSWIHSKNVHVLKHSLTCLREIPVNIYIGYRLVCLVAPTGLTQTHHRWGTWIQTDFFLGDWTQASLVWKPILEHTTSQAFQPERGQWCRVSEYFLCSIYRTW